MKPRFLILLGITGLCALSLESCRQGPTVSTTKGTTTIECDESLLPVMKIQAEDFHNTYTEATINLRPVEAREAVVNFVNDSVRVITMAREFNKEELDFLKRSDIQYEAFKVALGAIAVIVNAERRDTLLRVTELDSIFSGLRTQWNPKTRELIDAYVGDINSSTDEVFKSEILNGKPFGPTITRIKSSDKLIEEVAKNRNGIGLVGVSWLEGHEDGIRVCRLGGGSYQPDSTVVAGQFFSPAQAHILRHYYPITREVYMYTREVRRDVGYGFIAYVKESRGQQIFVNHMLVPASLPVRIANITSQKVQ
jgi:phosphate transport system substrate-binding protein